MVAFVLFPFFDVYRKQERRKRVVKEVVTTTNSTTSERGCQGQSHRITVNRHNDIFQKNDREKVPVNG